MMMFADTSDLAGFDQLFLDLSFLRSFGLLVLRGGQIRGDAPTRKDGQH